MRKGASIFDIFDDSGIAFLEVLEDNFNATDNKVVENCLGISKEKLLYDFHEHKEHLLTIQRDFEASRNEHNEKDKEYYHAEMEEYIKTNLETFCGALVRYLYPKIVD